MKIIFNCNLVGICIFLFCVKISAGSNGDRNTYFQNCRSKCTKEHCSEDGFTVVSRFHQTTLEKLFLWTCFDECQYECMWATVDGFTERGWPVPQFYGKWPFVRFLGIQEPASVVFSLMNFCTHFYLLKKFRQEVRPDSPCYKLWHIFSLICLNGWIWSTVFHARDYMITELLDYASAYSMVLVSLYCMSIRMVHNKSIVLRGIITAVFLSFYLNYFAYLSVGRFSYSFNMTTNIVTGVLSGIGWLIWCFRVRKNRPYYKKMLQFYILFALSMSLELLDFAPIWWTFDAHSLWHLSTIPLCFVFYSFLIDDCQMLRKEKTLEEGMHNKQI